ncbi:MAG: hypothetical protein ACOYEC_01765 [Christensenellales bacterium]|jgi:chromosome segregation ATPase|nr:hypothetical protein [Clostridiales bacterium]
MKRYVPSIENNNRLKEEIIIEVNTLIYRLQRGKHNKNIDAESVKSFAQTLKREAEALQHSLGTGKEDILNAVISIREKIDNVKKEAQQSFAVRLGEAVDELAADMELLRDIINGDAIDYDEVAQKEKKLSYSVRKLHEKLNELRYIKEECSLQERRLEADIAKIEKEIEELENKMIEEDNERILNDLYRRIASSKNKADTLSARRSNYSVCYNFLDMIEANVNEILLSGEFSGSELSKAKTLLNMSRIRESIANPEQVIPILKVLKEDIKAIHEKVKSIDKRLFEINAEKSELNQDALSYKEMLIARKKEKQMLKEDSPKPQNQVAARPNAGEEMVTAQKEE